MKSELWKVLSDAGHHDLVCGLFVELPITGEPFGATKQAKWLAAAAAIFSLLYTEAGKKQIVNSPKIIEQDIPERVEPILVPASDGRHTINRPQVVVFEALKNMPKNEHGQIEATVRHVARAAGVSGRGINNALFALEHKGLIAIERRPDHETNFYTIVGKGQS